MALPPANKKVPFIRDLFSRIAKRYDFLNDLMTFSLHRQWKKELIKRCGVNKSAVVLDLCTGTGDLAFLWAENPNVTKVYAVDSCAPMLEQAKLRQAKSKNLAHKKIEFLEGDAMLLDFDDNSFDAVTVGFGLRNVAELDKAILEIKRVLKPSSVIASLDLGQPPNPVLNSIYTEVFLKFIPSLGASFAKDKAAYEYLVDSLKTWPEQKVLADKFWQLGFSACYFKNLVFGAIAIVVARS